MQNKKRGIDLKKIFSDNLSLYLLFAVVTVILIVFLFYRPGILLSPEDCEEGEEFNQDTELCEVIEDGVWVDGSEYLFDENGESFLDDIENSFSSLVNPDDPNTDLVEEAFIFDISQEDYDNANANLPADLLFRMDYQDEFVQDCIAGETNMDPNECGNIAPIVITPSCKPDKDSETVTKRKTVILDTSTDAAQDKTTLLNEAGALRREAVNDQTRIANGMNCVPETEDTTCTKIGKASYSLSVKPLKKIPGACKKPRPNSQDSPKVELNNGLSARGNTQSACINNLGDSSRTWSEPIIQAYNCESSFSCKIYTEFDLTDVSYDSSAMSCTGKGILKLWCGDRPQIDGIIDKQASVDIVLVGTFNLKCEAKFNQPTN